MAEKKKKVENTEVTENKVEAAVEPANEATKNEENPKTKTRIRFQSPIRKETVTVDEKKPSDDKAEEPKVPLKNRIKKVATIVGLTVGTALAAYGGYLMGRDGTESGEDNDSDFDVTDCSTCESSDDSPNPEGE